MDIAITVAMDASIGAQAKLGLIGVEVGRNRMEAGKAIRLVWSGSQSLPDYPTLRALAEASPARVLQLVRAYLAGPKAGA